MAAAVHVYILRYKDGTTRRVTIPAGSRVTFGPAIPFAARGGEYSTATANTYAIRVYETESEKSSLLGVFTGILEFHRQDVQYDLGPPVQAKRMIEDDPSPDGGLVDYVIPPTTILRIGVATNAESD